MTGLLHRIALVGFGAALLTLSACHIPGGSGHPELAIDIAWDGYVECTPEPPYPAYWWNNCNDDGLVTVTNVGDTSTAVPVRLSFSPVHDPQYADLEDIGDTEATFTENTCNVVLGPNESCTAHLHAEVDRSSLNGIDGTVYAKALFTVASYPFVRTTG